MSYAAQYPETQWTLHAIATIHGEPAARIALEKLCILYRPPVMALFLGKGVSREDAEDLTQKLLTQLSHSRIWQRADPQKGRFRDYLHQIALHAYCNYCRYLKTERRNGGKVPESLDLLLETGTAPAGFNGDDSSLFDREWAWTVLHNALHNLSTAPEWSRYFPYARQFFPGGHRLPSQAEAAAALGVKETSIGKVIERLRSAFGQCVRHEVRQTLGPLDDLEEEMGYLRSILEKDPPEITPSREDS